MATGEKIVTIRNHAGQIQDVRASHPILRDPDIEIVPRGTDPDGTDDVIPFDDWSVEELKRYADENGIDIGRASKAETIAARIRAAEGLDGE
jgi:hypothetical protein